MFKLDIQRKMHDKIIIFLSLIFLLIMTASFFIGNTKVAFADFMKVYDEWGLPLREGNLSANVLDPGLFYRNVYQLGLGGRARENVNLSFIPQGSRGQYAIYCPIDSEHDWLHINTNVYADRVISYGSGGRFNNFSVQRVAEDGRTFKLFQRGEPLLAHGIGDSIYWSIDYRQKEQFILITNGLLLSAQTKPVSVEQGKDFVINSVDTLFSNIKLGEGSPQSTDLNPSDCTTTVISRPDTLTPGKKKAFIKLSLNHDPNNVYKVFDVPVNVLTDATVVNVTTDSTVFLGEQRNKVLDYIVKVGD
ncbi:hypothetical protein, partial [Enterococcus faecalis]|uniref:hypothetical protein n=1 Tax=Enterococcus faecalis TaxID=1351 RepID=UPI003D12B135